MIKMRSPGVACVDPTHVRTFPFVTAVYREETHPGYRGNQYIEALPSLPDDKTLTKALSYLPPFDEMERFASPEWRIQRLDLIKKILVALPRVVRLARAMTKMMIGGYAARRPYSSDEASSMQAMYALQQKTGMTASLRQADVAPQRTLCLIGASGSGKSFTLEHITKMLPSVIYHPDIGRWQLPYVVIEMSYDGQSVATLATRMFEAFDKKVPDGNYAKNYRERSGFNAEQRLATAFLVARGLGVGFLAVDESQNQSGAHSEQPEERPAKRARKSEPANETPLTKLLTTASNTSDIPLLFMGTLEMKTTIGGRFTRARRMSGNGSATWLPLGPPSKDRAKLSEFDLLLKALFRYQWVRTPVVLDSVWANLFYEISQGIPDIVVKLFESSQEAAISGGTETLTLDLVRAVFAREFGPAQFGLIALRTKDPVMLDAVPDLYSQPLVVPPQAETTTQPPSGALVTPTASMGQKPTARRSSVKAPAEAPKPALLAANRIAGADIRLSENGKPPPAGASLSFEELDAEVMP